VQTYCFNATTGSPIWSTPSKITDEGGVGDWTCSLAVADGIVYVGSAEEGYFGYENLYVLDAFTGNVVWNSPYAGSSPALSDGMLFSIGGDQKVYAFKDSSTSPVANFIANVKVVKHLSRYSSMTRPPVHRHRGPGTLIMMEL